MAKAHRKYSRQKIIQILYAREKDVPPVSETEKFGIPVCSIQQCYQSCLLVCTLFCSAESKQGPGLTLDSCNYKGNSNNKKKYQWSQYS